MPSVFSPVMGQQIQENGGNCHVLYLGGEIRSVPLFKEKKDP